MPTFTTIALENLLEHRISHKNSSTFKDPPPVDNKPKSLQIHEGEIHEAAKEEKSNPKKPLNHIYISPALYTTPEPTPILDSESLSPSPYVFNRKGRGGGKFAKRRVDGFEIQKKGNQSGADGGEEELVEGSLFGGDGENESFLVGADDDDDFVDTRCDLLSVTSSSEMNDRGRLGVENMSVVSNQFGEFYDAIEDFSSDSASSAAPCGRSIESELHATRLSILEEIEKRKTAEDAVATLCTQWQRFSNLLLSQTGLSFPAPSNASSPMQLDINALEQLSEEVIVARFVAEAIGRGQARAEVELAAAVIIESKEQEISRLRDRLQYYEAMNNEMSQRNLEAMEVARRERERKRWRRKWLWSCIGISIGVGVSVIAYSYTQQTRPLETASDPHLDATTG